MDEILSDDSLIEIMKCLDIKESVTIQRVDRRWCNVAKKRLRSQRKLGFAFGQMCGDRNHRVGWLDIVNCRYLWNENQDLTVLREILRQCPNVRSISIKTPADGEDSIYQYPMDDVDRKRRPKLAYNGTFGAAKVSTVNTAELFKVIDIQCRLLECIQFDFSSSTVTKDFIDYLKTKCHLTHVFMCHNRPEDAAKAMSLCSKVTQCNIWLGGQKEDNDDHPNEKFRNQVENFMSIASGMIREITCQAFPNWVMREFSFGFKNLTSLELWFYDKPNPDCLLSLGNIANLEKIVIDSYNLDANDSSLMIVAMANLRKLKSIRWTSDHWVPVLKALPEKCPQMECITARPDKTTLTISDIAPVMRLTRLREVHFTFLNLTSTGEFEEFMDMCHKRTGLSKITLVSGDWAFASVESVQGFVDLVETRSTGYLFVDVFEWNFDEIRNLKHFINDHRIIPRNLTVLITGHKKLYHVSSDGFRVRSLNNAKEEEMNSEVEISDSEENDMEPEDVDMEDETDDD